ncbi:MAG: IMP dehydrogenase [Ignavibacteriota bacterium]
MKTRKAYSFDDVMLVPRYSRMNTRADANLSTSVAGVPLRIPIIAANMSSVWRRHHGHRYGTGLADSESSTGCARSSGSWRW